MNKLFFVLLLFVLNTGYAQKSIVYYNSDNEVTDAEHSYFYKIKEGNIYRDSVVSYYTLSNRIRSQEKYNETGLRVGMYREFYENGNLKIAGNYSGGKRSDTFMYWYENGKPYMTLLFPSETKEISQWEDINYKIEDYWDSLGNQTVKNGDGFCDGYIDVGYNRERIHEKGNVKSGLRDSIWIGTINNKVVIRETYEKGEFVDGVRLDSEKKITYTDLATTAEYKGGLEAMVKFINATVKYPKDARKQGIQGVVFTSFIVEVNGLIDKITVVKGVYPSLDEEAVRVIKMMKWKPAKYRGKAVRSRYVFPLKFKLGS
jgi:TonB family protein